MSLPDFARMLGPLHFLRPWWLCALLALPVLAWGWRARHRHRNPWRGIVDPHLLPHLLQSVGARRNRLPLVVAGLGYTLAVLALAGPSWRQSAQPLWQTRTPVVIALDLSSATLAADLPPSRLVQARAKLTTLLHERNGGPVGLVAYAGDAFTVAPLTDDAANVALFLDALQPDLMPVDGQRTDHAIAWAVRLLEHAAAGGGRRGDIVLLTDHADHAAVAAAAEAAHAGHRISVLGLGTATGAAYRRPDGTIATARLDAASLRELAARGNGRYAALAADAADLRSLGLLESGTAGTAHPDEGGRAWQDEGYWLLPPLMLLALFAFRRRSGALAVLLLAAALPLRPTQAAELWRRPDQASHAQLERGNAAYRAGDFAAAARHYERLDSATAHYNRGNALAKARQYPQAIAAYDQALRRQPRMADALANKRAVEAAMQRRPPSAASQGSRRDPAQAQAGQGGQAGPQAGPGQPHPAAPQRARPSPPGRPPGSPLAASAPSPQPPATPTDATAQQEANRAQRERMRRALQQARTGAGRRDPQAGVRLQETPEQQETPKQRERRLANEAWLRRVPDDPGGLLRARFRLEHERRLLQGRAEP